jgi:hypothetical protein
MQSIKDNYILGDDRASKIFLGSGKGKKKFSLNYESSAKKFTRFRRSLLTLQTKTSLTKFGENRDLISGSNVFKLRNNLSTVTWVIGVAIIAQAASRSVEL